MKTGMTYKKKNGLQTLTVTHIDDEKVTVRMVGCYLPDPLFITRPRDVFVKTVNQYYDFVTGRMEPKNEETESEELQTALF
jgi:hypothetical protein